MTKSIITSLALAIMITTQAFGTDKDKTKIVAHRGYWNCQEAGFARNSVAALKAAQDNYFWGSEFDVNITKDGVLLVWHDGKIGDKVIESTNYEEFKNVRLANGEPIPTIDDYLIQANKNKSTCLVYELKSQSNSETEDMLVDLSIRKLKEYKLFNPKNVIFISFSFHMCYKIASEHPEFTVQYLGSDMAPEALMRYGIKGLDYHYNAFREHADWSGSAHKLNMTTNAWTVNEDKDINFILDEKIGHITSDNPDLVRKIMSERNIKECKAK